MSSGYLPGEPSRDVEHAKGHCSFGFCTDADGATADRQVESLQRHFPHILHLAIARPRQPSRGLVGHAKLPSPPTPVGSLLLGCCTRVLVVISAIASIAEMLLTGPLIHLPASYAR